MNRPAPHEPEATIGPQDGKSPVPACDPGDATLAPDSSPVKTGNSTIGKRAESTLGPEESGALPRHLSSDATLPPPVAHASGSAQTSKEDVTLADSPGNQPPSWRGDETLAPGAGDSDATLPPPAEACLDGATMPPTMAADDSGATVAPDQSRVMAGKVNDTVQQKSPADNRSGSSSSGLKGSQGPGVGSVNQGAKGKLPQVPGYEILGELGRGGMGVVYRARQLGLNRMVALKMVLNSQASDSELERFRLEARSVATAQHPNIVNVFDVGEFNGLPYMALEFVEGGPLDNRLKGEPQDPQFTARVMEQVCRAMQHAHSLKIIHRDLKPANILLTKEDLPKVTDFGLAKELDAEDGHTRTGSIMGTPSYMPPEQAEGKAKELTPVADIYSLGAILYEFLTGRPPFKGRTLLETLEHVRKKDPVSPADLNPTVPVDLQTIALKALEKDPAKRYQTAAEMAEDLQAFSKGEPIKARPISRWQKTVKWAKRNKAAALVTSMGAVLFLVVLLGSLALNTANSIAENSRRKLQGQIDSARETARGALQAGREALASRRFEEAKSQVESGMAALGTVSSGNDEARQALEDLDGELGSLLKEVRQHLATDKVVADFDKARDAAVFAHVNQVGSEPGELRNNIREAVEKAFKLVKLDQAAENPVPSFDEYFRPEEQQRIRANCGELFVLVADTQFDGGDLEGAKRNLLKARSLLPIEKLYHLKLASYLRSSDKDAAMAERAKADQARAGTALEWFLVGDEFFKDKELNRAADAFREALIQDPKNFWAQYFLATIALSRGENDAAHSGYLVARSIQPDFPYTDVMIAICEAREGDMDEAERHFQRAEKVIGDTTLFLVNHAVARVGQAQKLMAGNRRAEAAVLLGLAEKDLRKSVEKEPSVEGLSNLARVLDMQGKDKESEEILKKAVVQYPKAPAGTWAAYGQSLARSAGKDAKLLGEAAMAFQEAANREPDRKLVSDYALECGSLLMQMGDLEGAARKLESAFLANPENPRVHFALGNLNFSRGMRMPKGDVQGVKYLAEASDSFRRYLELETSRKSEDRPKLALAWERLGTIQARQGDMVAALASQTQALSLDPKTPSIRRMRGWNLMNQWRSAALADFEAGLQENPSGNDKVDLHLGRGFLRAQKGDVQGALEDLREIEKLSKDQPGNLLNSATILAQVAGIERKKGSAAKAEVNKTMESMVALINRAMEKIPAQSRGGVWARFQVDEGFDPVRDLEAFKELDQKFKAAVKP